MIDIEFPMQMVILMLDDPGKQAIRIDRKRLSLDILRLYRDLFCNKFFRAWDFYLLDFFDPLLVRLI